MRNGCTCWGVIYFAPWRANACRVLMKRLRVLDGSWYVWANPYQRGLWQKLEAYERSTKLVHHLRVPH